MEAGTIRRQRKGLDPLELKLQMAVSLPTWVLRSKLSSSGKVRSTLNLSSPRRFLIHSVNICVLVGEFHSLSAR